jgi:hypothetical protein
VLAALIARVVALFTARPAWPADDEELITRVIRGMKRGQLVGWHAQWGVIVLTKVLEGDR